MRIRPSAPSPPPELHRSHRAGWLRAAVLGADDGIVSTASLMIGMAAANSGRNGMLTAGVAGLAAGAMAMAAGEFVSVAAQRDTEHADLSRERHELATSPASELEELTVIYQRRGLDRSLARQVAEQLTRHDALGTHAREELGLSAETMAHPFQAAASSAAAFAIGAVLPIIALLLSPSSARVYLIVATAVAGLGVLGRLGAAAGGARWTVPTTRVVVGGALAMGVTALVGLLTHTAGV